MLSATKILGVFYHPPNSSSDYLCQLNILYHVSFLVILCGDFNIPHINWTNISSMTSSGVTKKLCDLVLDHSLQHLVLEPTHHGNVLDLLLTNCPDRGQKVELEVQEPTALSSRPVHTNSDSSFKEADQQA